MFKRSFCAFYYSKSSQNNPHKQLNLFKSTAKPDNDFDHLKNQAITWTYTGDAEYPFSNMNNQNMRIRINDFPEQPLYSLIVNGESIADMDCLPSDWQMPFEQMIPPGTSLK